jgi:cell division protein FtsI/penicillin-binding protein 2
MVRKALRYPVSLESGTAHVLEIPGFEICAKTGTAQVHGQESHGWVAGFFPLSEPRYAFCVLLENVGSSHYACALAHDLFEEAKKRGKLS